MDKNIEIQKITDTLEKNYMPYAMSVIVSRAIPEIDGFKPSHRKLLYTMYKMGLLKGAKIKSANVVGQTMKLNPHGDGAIYETLVRLTRGNDALLHPFIDSKGNFGKQCSRDMAYAASRYTEVKLDDICQELFKDIDKDTVDFVDNYDGTTTEPLLFPTTFPNILVSPNQGIAVGMSSSMCGFNLNEVVKTTIAFIKNPNIDILKTLKAPDFSTGGHIIFDETGFRKIYETGRGSVKVRGKYNYDEKNNCIEITEIPYSTTVEVIIDKVIALIKSNKIKEITDIRDETGLNGLKITIDVKKNTNIDMLMHRLYSMTTLSDSFSCNFNLLINGHPKTLGVAGILENWIDFRISCIRRQTNFDIKAKREKLDLLLGLSKILLDIDKAIKIIRQTEEDKEVIPNLMNGFEIKENQAEYIAEIKLRNLNKQYLLNRISEKEKLETDLKELQILHDSDEKIKELICEQLKEVSKKYGRPRKTEIISDEDILEFSEDEFVSDHGIKLFLTQEGYFKKIPLTSLRSAFEQNLKDGDKIIQEIETTNKSEILFFTSKQNVYKLKVPELNEVKASSIGEYLPNLIGTEENENILLMININNNSYTGHLIFGFNNGKFAKIPLSSYETNRKKLTNAFSNKFDLVNLFYITEDIDLVALRDNDKAMVFNTSLISEKITKNTIGIQIFNLKKNSVMSEVIKPSDFDVSDIEYYRVKKVPSGGHFIMGK